MPDGIAESRTMRARHLALLALRMSLLCMTMAACSLGGEDAMTFVSAPGKYEYHNCDQLAAARKATVARQKELKELIEQAERSTAGVFVGAFTYRSEHLVQTEDLRLIDAAARAKDCLTAATWRSNAVIQ
jgi:hypothetical protein